MNVLCEFNWDYFIRILSLVTPFALAYYVFWLSKKYQDSNKKIAEEKLERELFKEFNERYDELNEDLLDSKNLEEIHDGNERHIKIKKSIIDYFNLCAEEYYWQKKGRISNEIWNSWKAGMKMNYSLSKVIRKLWEEECQDEGFKSYYLNSPKELFE